MKIMLLIAVTLFTMGAMLPGIAADPSNRFWYSVTISKVNTAETFTGSSELTPEEFATSVAGASPVLLENLRIEGLIPGDDAVKWHVAVERTNVNIMPRAVLFYEILPGDPALNRRQAQATFRSIR